MAGKCIKPDCECLDYYEADDPHGKPQARMVRCEPQSIEHLQYHNAWLKHEPTEKGFVAGMKPVFDGELWIEVKFVPQVFV